MADLSGEAAFLASMGGAAEYDPASYDPADQTPAQDMEHDEEEEEEDDEDYDPSSFMPNQPEPPAAVQSESSVTLQPAVVDSQPPSQIPSRTASSMSGVQKPKTIGGFIEEEDDDDDDDEEDEDDDSQEQEQDTGTNAHSVDNPPEKEQDQEHAPPAAISTPGVAVAPAPASAPVQALPQPNAPVTLPASSSSAAASLSKPRLPQDRIGQLEDRIADDPKGDVDAWLDLISLHRSKNKLDDARNVYDRFFELFPTAAEQWVAYALMEQEQDDFVRLENIFNTALLKNYNVQLWGIYLDYIRRRNNVMNDTTGQARQTITQAYDFALNLIGNDKDSGSMWQDYINFIKSSPGNPGGNGWQDAQKMDVLRKAYQRAITVPMQATTSLWKEYDSFEMGLNKMTGRKFLQEKSPAYMTARTSYNMLQKITQDLRRTSVPTLAPAPGCQGDDEYQQQVCIWQNWIQWEKEDPLVLKDEDIKAYRDRVLYVYRQATMALRFWPQIWYDAAEFCFDNEMDTEASDFLAQGTAANPESCLLAFTRADRIEQTMPVEDGEESLVRRGEAVKEPYDNCLNALYALIDKIKAREPKAIAQIKEYYESLPPLSHDPTPEARDDDDDEHTNNPAANSRAAEEQKQIAEVQNNSAAQIKTISKTLSFVWIALMRAMRRIQGKGKPDAPVGGLRNVFALARKRGRITSDVYVATALIEYHCYKDPAATKIFERGMKLFPEDELFAMEYLKHLIATNDVTNARAVFETTVSRLSAKPENIPRTKPLYLFIHEYESNYGELAQISKLEKRMADLFPEDPSLVRFGHRFRIPTFDPCTVRTIISPNAQTRPKGSAYAMPTTETEPLPNPAAILSAATGYVQSPKRPHDGADSDAEQPARKLARGESPLKGAAGRRQQQRQRAEGYGSQVAVPPPKPLPRDITLLLSMIPNAATYPANARLNPESMVGLLRGIDPGRVMQQGGGGGGYGGGYINYGR